MPSAMRGIGRHVCAQVDSLLEGLFVEAVQFGYGGRVGGRRSGAAVGDGVCHCFRTAAGTRDFLGKWQSFYQRIGEIGLLETSKSPTIWLSALCLGVLVLWPKITRRLPASLIAMVMATVIVQVFNVQVETIGSRFGAIPRTLPAPDLPVFDLQRIRDLIGPATTIAILAAIESLLSAVVADGMIGTRHKSNLELV